MELFFKVKAFLAGGGHMAPHVESVGEEPMSNRVKEATIVPHIDSYLLNVVTSVFRSYAPFFEKNFLVCPRE